MNNGATVRVLIVDDEPLFRNSLAEGLGVSCPAYEILEASNGREALDLLESATVDVVVTDIKMPVLDGVQLVLALQQARFLGHVIVVTAFGSSRIEDQVVSHGAIGYLEKPVDLPCLIDMVRTAAEGERSHIEGLTLAGITQLLEVERKTCLLRVSKGTRSGDLIFDDGVLVDARLEDLSGTEAALEMLAWDDSAGLDLLAGVGLHDTRIKQGLTHLILEAMRRKDEAQTGKQERSKEPPEPVQPTEREMGNVLSSLSIAMEIDGAIGVALVDHESGMSLGQAGGGERLNLDVAGAGNTAVVRAKLRVMNDLGLDDKIEDILITLGDQFHLIRPMVKSPNLFLYVALDRNKANLAMARHQLTSIERGLKV